MQQQSPGKQLLLLLGIYACCMFMGQLIAQAILLNYAGNAIEDFDTLDPMLILGSAAVMHFFSHLVTFAVFMRFSGMTFAQFFPKPAFHFLILLALPILALLGIVCMSLLSEMVLHFFESGSYYSVIEQYTSQQDMVTRLLVHQNPAQLAMSLFTLCLLPALGEEFLYRGILQTRLMAATHDRHFSVIIASIIFAAMHMQPVNLLSIALLGLVLGYLYSYTKNIWYGVILHFLVNAVQVVQLYFWPQLGE